MTDRTWRCSTCANEHDETMPHDTDRASAEGLRHPLDEAAQLTERGYVVEAYRWLDKTTDTYVVAASDYDALRAALLDTGPRPDSGIDVQRLALIHRPVTNPWYPRPICEDDGQEWPCKTAIVARLSTPRTETSAKCPDCGQQLFPGRSHNCNPAKRTISTPRTETSES